MELDTGPLLAPPPPPPPPSPLRLPPFVGVEAEDEFEAVVSRLFEPRRLLGLSESGGTPLGPQDSF